MKKFIAKRLAQMLVVFVAVSMFAFSIIFISFLCERCALFGATSPSLLINFNGVFSWQFVYGLTR